MIFALMVSTTVGFCHYIFMSVLPGYALRLGGGPQSAGLIMGVYSFSALLTRPVSGYFMDTRGRRAVMIAGVTLFLAGSIALTRADRTWLLIAVRVVQGIGFSAVSSSIAVIVADLSPPRRLSEGLGWSQACNSLTLATGPVFGLAVVASAGYAVLFPMIAAIIVAGAAVSLLVNYPGSGSRSAGKRGLRPAGGASARDASALAPGILWIASINFLMSLGLGTMFSFVLLHGTSIGIRQTSLFFPLFALASIIAVRTLSGTLERRFGPARLLAAGLSAISCAFIALGLSDSSLPYLASALFLGAGSGISFTMGNTILLSGTSPENRGLSNAIGFAAIDIGIGTGSLLGGLLAVTFGYSGLFLAASGTGIAALAILAVRARSASST